MLVHIFYLHIEYNFDLILRLNMFSFLHNWMHQENLDNERDNRNDHLVHTFLFDDRLYVLKHPLIGHFRPDKIIDVDLLRLHTRTFHMFLMKLIFQNQKKYKNKISIDSLDVTQYVYLKTRYAFSWPIGE